MYEVEIKRCGIPVYSQRFADINVGRVVKELNDSWWAEVEAKEKAPKLEEGGEDGR